MWYSQKALCSKNQDVQYPVAERSTRYHDFRMVILRFFVAGDLKARVDCADMTLAIRYKCPSHPFSGSSIRPATFDSTWGFKSRL
ncbi:hypothetical protein PM082_021188 [Marasmius tenuissimus]|nr:hypothetical protein PM082_021188 [Marasmius tenuissimus]